MWIFSFNEICYLPTRFARRGTNSFILICPAKRIIFFSQNYVYSLARVWTLITGFPSRRTTKWAILACSQPKINLDVQRFLVSSKRMNIGALLSLLSLNSWKSIIFCSIEIWQKVVLIFFQLKQFTETIDKSSWGLHSFFWLVLKNWPNTFIRFKCSNKARMAARLA